MKKRAALALLSAVALAACGQGTPPPSAAPGDRGQQASSKAGPAVKSGPFDVTERGVGALGASTAWSVEAVRTAFPDVTAERRFIQFDEGPVPVIRADAPDGTALEVLAGAGERVGTVVVLGGPFTGPGGERLLQPWAETGFRRHQCRTGEVRWINAPVCRRPDGSRVTVVFSVPGWTDPTRLPDEATLREKARVQAFVWSAP